MADIYLMEEGDSLLFESRVPHRNVNPGPGQAKGALGDHATVVLRPHGERAIPRESAPSNFGAPCS